MISSKTTILISEIIPVRVHTFDQIELILSGTSLDLMFAEKWTFLGIRHFNVNQNVQLIPRIKAFHHVILMCPHSLSQVAGHARIKGCMFLIGKDINAKI